MLAEKGALTMENLIRHFLAPATFVSTHKQQIDFPFLLFRLSGDDDDRFCAHPQPSALNSWNEVNESTKTQNKYRETFVNEKVSCIQMNKTTEL